MPNTSPKPPRATPQSRGEEARLRILEAAIEEFAARGYRGASTRQLAESAGVNLGALTYYFGGKPNLYTAALEHVIARIDDVTRPMAERVLAALADDRAAPSQDLRPLLLAFLDQWLDIMLGRSNLQWRPSWSLLLTRAEVEPPEADGQLRALNWTDIDEDRRDQLRAVLHRNAIAALDNATGVTRAVPL
jgi:AcrR family transcriptional regulator